MVCVHVKQQAIEFLFLFFYSRSCRYYNEMSTSKGHRTMEMNRGSGSMKNEPVTISSRMPSRALSDTAIRFRARTDGKRQPKKEELLPVEVG